ncbi:glycosyltransferase family 61 protein [Roseomonas terrae]|uniref:Glycosyltransferase family 61 protein n=1 Tax=Neoroseomonas terrae TaxID=424799 RepID=A0ABS5EMP5_9PROT|nr:glycosyltransferase family 61 protein [Neoroseomonas terrae]
MPANLRGSVQHFYHFMFGYVLPFLEHASALRDTHRFLVRDCGPLNHLLAELDGFRLQVISAHTLLSGLVGVNEEVGKTPRMIVPGFDSPRAYARDRLLRIRRVVQDLYGERIAAAAASHPATASDRLVLVVDRAPPSPFYRSAASEVRTAGAERRSVPNMAEVHAAIAARHDTLLVRLEGCSLFEQIHLFSRAWRVVGQHGAGLAHMIWARPDAGLVEILPAENGPSVLPPVRLVHFQRLCAVLGLAWNPVMQAGHHAPVDPTDILAALG